MVVAAATVLSLPALAAIATRYVRQHGASDADQVVDHVALAANFDTERAQAGVRLALIGRRLVLDRGGVLRLPDPHHDRIAA